MEMIDNFVIPEKRDDLFHRTSPSQYVVNEIATLRQVPAVLHELKQIVRSQSNSTITENFSSFFGLLCLQKELSRSQKEETWTCIYKSYQAFRESISKVIQSGKFNDDRNTWVNSMKMNVYILCEFMDIMENDSRNTQNSDAFPLRKGRARTKSSKVNDTHGLDWNSERQKGIATLHQSVQLPLHKLWSPAIVDEDLVRLITNRCYGLMENAEVVKDKELMKSIYHILGIMLKHYNHSLSASLFIPNLLRNYDHLATPLVQASVIFINEFGMKSVVSRIIQEIANMDAGDMCKNTNGARTIAQYLVELSELQPTLLLSNICVLVEFLDNDPYILRNSVLTVMSEIIIRVLSDQTLSIQQKNTRDEILDYLEEHLNDTNSFVRSKVLHLWLCIVNNECLPLSRQESLVDVVLVRLRDKSCLVRKSAIQLLYTLVKCNPYADKLPVEDLRTNYKREKAKLDEMIRDLPTTPGDDDNRKMYDDEWADLEKQLNEFYQTCPSGDEYMQTLDDGSNFKSAKDICTLIHEHLIKQEFSQAFSLLTHLQEAFPDLACLHKERNELESGMADHSNESMDSNPDNEFAEKLTYLKAIFIECKSGNTATLSEADQSKNENVLKQTVVVSYLKNTLAFAVQLQQSIPLVCQCLSSSTTSDVLEAVEFFTTIHNFGVANSLVGVRRMLSLIWSTEAGIKDCVVRSYKRLYFTSKTTNSRLNAVSIVQNLMSLLHGCSFRDMISMEALVGELYTSEDIDGKIIQLLWERFTLKLAETTQEECHSALTILSMIATVDPEVIQSNINLLVSDGLVRRGKTDLELSNLICKALLKTVSKQKSNGSAKVQRYPADHEIFAVLTDILVSSFMNIDELTWVRFADQAIHVIYRLAEHPDQISAKLLKTLVGNIARYDSQQTTVEQAMENLTIQSKDDAEVESRNENVEETKESSENNGTDRGQSTSVIPAALLSRLIFMVGCVALRQAVLFDVDVIAALKQRQGKQDKNKPGKLEETDLAEEEMGLAGASADDVESDLIYKIMETEIVTNQNLLALFAPLIVAICRNPVKYDHADLQASASIALANYMLVSSAFCDANLQLLFTILEKSTSEIIRANLVVAIGDMMVRHTNLLEPWTPNIFARLRNESLTVRKNTLRVLSHLILNDMIRVSGQISVLAVCLIDDNPMINNLSKQFFGVLSKKGSFLNLLLDIISRLSDPEVGVDAEKFQVITKFLFSFVDKDRHCENLVERICQRFRTTSSERQSRDLAYCLSLLSYSSRCFTKLQDNFDLYADKMVDEEVYASFSLIVSNAKRGVVKPEWKTVVEEYENRLLHVHTRCDEGMPPPAMKNTRKTPHKNSKLRKTPARRPKRKVSSDSDDSSTEISNSQRKQSTRGQRKPMYVDSSSDEGDDAMFSPPTHAALASVRSTRKTKSQACTENKENTPLKTPQRARRKKRLSTLMMS